MPPKPPEKFKDDPYIVVNLAESGEPSEMTNSLKELADRGDIPLVTDLITTKDSKVILKTKLPGGR